MYAKGNSQLEVQPIGQSQKSDPGREQGVQEQTHQVESKPQQEVSGRLSSQKTSNIATSKQRERESSRSAAAAQSTPLFIGTRHKELRSLLQSRDDPDRWAAMLEMEHPASEWCEAYRSF